jgi:hypothetical protein
MKNWDDYWNSTNINRKIMEVWATYFVGACVDYLSDTSEDVVLDFGAGYGHVSNLLRDKVRKIYLFDKAPYMQDFLHSHFDGEPNMKVVSEWNEIPEKVTLIIVNSVSQYISKEDFRQVLLYFSQITDHRSRVIISDIIPEGYSLLADFTQQLTIGIRHGFFRKLIAYAVSNMLYKPSLVLSDNEMVTYKREEMDKLLTETGFKAEISPVNFTYSKKRFTVIARPSAIG